MDEPVSERRPLQLVLRRYQAVTLLLSVVLLGSVSLFSRGGVYAAAEPRRPYRIALTFDDGPHPDYTERLLKVLREERAAATFFVVGKQAEKYPYLLQAIHRCGHEIANHTYHHPNLTQLPLAEAKLELDDTRRLIDKLIGRETRFFRPPGGRYNPDVLAMAAENGYHMVLWNVFPQDHRRPPPQEIYDRVMADAKDGGVVLLHSGVDSTIEVLPRLIEDLRAKGFRFLTISEMLEEDVDPQVVSTWFLPKGVPPPAAEGDQPPLSIVQTPGDKRS
jgi:peptidoglycan/xylan/chitin deacetylase (PgdA/CDA1 family)